MACPVPRNASKPLVSKPCCMCRTLPPFALQWSLGVTIWEMVTRKRPWASCNMAEYYREVVIRKSRLPIPQVCP